MRNEYTIVVLQAYSTYTPLHNQVFVVMTDVVKRDWIMPLKREKFRSYRTQYRILQDWRKSYQYFRNIKDNPLTYTTVNYYV